jgi:hypothetical protein
LSTDGFSPTSTRLESPLALQAALLAQHYLADEGLSTVAFLAVQMSHCS